MYIYILSQLFRFQFQFELFFQCQGATMLHTCQSWRRFAWFRTVPSGVRRNLNWFKNRFENHKKHKCTKILKKQWEIWAKMGCKMTYKVAPERYLCASWEKKAEYLNICKILSTFLINTKMIYICWLSVEKLFKNHRKSYILLKILSKVLLNTKIYNNWLSDEKHFKLSEFIPSEETLQ